MAQVQAISIRYSARAASASILERKGATLGSLLEVPDPNRLTSLHAVSSHDLTVLMVHLQVRAVRLKLTWGPREVINAHVSLNTKT